MRIAIHVLGFEPHFLQHLGHAPTAFRLGDVRLVDGQPLLDDLHHRKARRQAAVGVLEDDLHVLAQRDEALALHVADLVAVEANAAFAGQQAQHGEAQRRLAGTGFAHHAHRLPGAHFDVHGVHRGEEAALAEPALADGVLHGELVGLGHQRRGLVGRRGIALRLGGEQLARVLVGRGGEYLPVEARLDDLAVGHHADAIGHVADDAEVVGDEQHGHVQLRLQILEQLQNLRLDGDVQRRGRLVGDQQLRLVGQRHGDHHALALAAGEFVGICAEAAFGVLQADQPQQFQGALAGLLGGKPLVDDQRFAHLLGDHVQRIEGRHRLLEDHAHHAAAHVQKPRLVRAEHFLAVHQHAAAGMVRLRIGQQLQHRERRHGLAGAGLAHQGHRLAGIDVEGDAAHRRRVAEAHVQIAHFQELGHPPSPVVLACGAESTRALSGAFEFASPTPCRPRNPAGQQSSQRSESSAKR